MGHRTLVKLTQHNTNGLPSEKWLWKAQVSNVRNLIYLNATIEFLYKFLTAKTLSCRWLSVKFILILFLHKPWRTSRSLQKHPYTHKSIIYQTFSMLRREITEPINRSHKRHNFTVHSLKCVYLCVKQLSSSFPLLEKGLKCTKVLNILRTS